MITFVVEPNEAGIRLDRFIAGKLIDVSRNRIQKAIEDHAILVNDRWRRVAYHVCEGDIVVVVLPPPQDDEFVLVPEDIPLDIVYEDDYMLVVNKPAGLVTHPAVGNRSGTLVHALLGYAVSLSQAGGSFRPGILHRLDKDTAGLLMVAKTDEIHYKLSKDIEKRAVHRSYLALVWGEPKWNEVQVNAPIGRCETDRKKMAVITDETKSRHAITDFTVKERYHGFTLLEAKLHTGRTHQVRIHASYIHHPLVGDPAYGGMRELPKNLFNAQKRKELDTAISALTGQALVAYKLEFSHPISKALMQLEAPIPEPINRILELLRQV